MIIWSIAQALVTIFAVFSVSKSSVLNLGWSYMIKCTGACHDIYRILGLSILCCQSRLIIWSNTQALVTIFATALNASPITPNEVALRKIAVSEVWKSGPQIVLKICSRYCFDFNCWPLPKKNLQANAELLSAAVKYADPRLLRVIFPLTITWFPFPTF